MSKAKHTQGKMVICISGTENNPSYALSTNGFIIFQTLGGNDENNAHRLCLCWNNHDALVVACKEMLEAIQILHRLDKNMGCCPNATDDGECETCKFIRKQKTVLA